MPKLQIHRVNRYGLQVVVLYLEVTTARVNRIAALFHRKVGKQTWVLVRRLGKLVVPTSMLEGAPHKSSKEVPQFVSQEFPLSVYSILHSGWI